MGGHGHGHGMEIPSPDRYNLENYPALNKYRERLAREGLKDPWLRNDAWRYTPKLGTKAHRVSLLLRGWKLGVPAFLITIAAEKLLQMVKKDDQDGDKHH
ncbi:hypothetical protein KPH14_005670 [Odynerus spinipes]|uniref:NADH dehydrogenase [ubiquinone] 1 beta subcomplex subunit 3 n=1 Tax=Odynerus spinipes TaxID=1348599 RepID=A0AAD9RC31_9HYME|nr:hypothetical protein KPH14_005670 [Odynerus spinipes]